VIWLPWRRKLALADERLRETERLRDDAEEQRVQVHQLAPRVDRVTSSLERLRAENHIGPLIESVLRGNE